VSAYLDVYNSFNEITGDTGRYHFDREQVDRFANRALDETCERARYKDTAETINVVADTAVYSATAAGYDIFRVEYEDEILFPITRDQLRHADRDWSSRTGLPKYYYLDEIYSTQDALSVGLWETPGTSVTDGLRLWYHGVPIAANSASGLTLATVMDIPDWASGAVLYYMLYLAYSADTKVQDFGASALYFMLYEDVLGRLVIRSNDRHPKNWVSGAPSSPSRSVLNRLPQRITE